MRILGGTILHPEGKGAQSPLDVHYDGYAFEVKAVSTRSLAYKATPKPFEIEQKAAHADELGVKAALAIVVIDSETGRAHAYYRDGLKGGRLSKNTGWQYLGSTDLPTDTVAAAEDKLQEGDVAPDIERDISEAKFDEVLHPRGRTGRWRKKLGGPRLDLKADKKLTKPMVHARAKKVVSALVDFYGGDMPEVHHEPEYLANVGSDARFRHQGELMAGVMYGNRVAERTADPELGVHEFRMIAHEAAHSLSGVKPGPLPGISQTVEEGAAEVLSLWFWKHRGQEMATATPRASTASGPRASAHSCTRRPTATRPPR